MKIISFGKSKGKEEIIEVGIQVLTMIISIFAISFMISLSLPVVEAVGEGISLQCCKESKGGERCQEYLVEDCNTNCEGECFPGRCEEYSECKLGCCIDSEEGICSSKSPKGRCESLGGIWENEPSCNIQECKLGCCVLGQNSEYATEERCDKLSGFYGLKTDFRQVSSEFECLVLAYSQDRGACVVSEENLEGEGRGCKVITKQECLALTEVNNFYPGLLCTNPDLNTNCTKTKETTCVDGRDGVYYLDSCGNVGNIYDSSRYEIKDYWDRIYEFNEVCNEGKAGVNSRTCGNCDYLLGSICGEAETKKPVYGNLICRNLECVDEEGNVRKNGESWCVHDGKIGFDGLISRDTAGSRYWKQYCLNGEIKVEPCEDYRNGICIQEEVDLGRGEKFSNAACVVNRWAECLEINYKSDLNKAREVCEGEWECIKESPQNKRLVKECEENPDCSVKNVVIDDSFAFSSCVPNYPPGFNLGEYEEGNEASGICSIASAECTIIYEKKLFSGWECIHNCECESIEFGNQLHDLCVSLGDCGGYMNYEGDFTEDGYDLRGDTELFGEGYLQERYSGNSVASEEYIKSEDYGMGLASNFGGVGSTYQDLAEENSQTSQIGGAVSLVAGGLSGVSGLIATSMVYFSDAGLSFGAIASAFSEGTLTINSLGGGVGSVSIEGAAVSDAGSNVPMSASSFNAFANVLGNFAAMMAVSSILSLVFGFQGDAATAMLVAGIAGGVIVGGATVAYAIAGKEALSCIAAGPLAVICLAVAVVILLIAVLLKIFGVGETKEKTAKFRCMPWQPPLGGEKCDLCNNNELKPCSKYRCESLGQTCKLINEGTGNEKCISISRNDVKAPVIEADEKVLSEEYKYNKLQYGVEIRKEDNSCVEPFTPLVFGIKTNEEAQCKLSIARNMKYEDMEEYFDGTNLYKENFTRIINLPSLESIKDFGINSTGELRYYVKCQDGNGNSNIQDFIIDLCVNPEPDLTPPKISLFYPESGGYVAFGEKNKTINFIVNEPAECRYDIEDRDFSLMSGNVSCGETLYDLSMFGVSCSASLSDLKEENNFYFRCKDMPWLNISNINQESTPYHLYQSKNNLSIDYIKPEGKIFSDFEPVSINLEARTSGGVNDVARCKYSLNNQSYIQFFETNSEYHNQYLNYIGKGLWSIRVLCEDEAGNIGYKEGEFSLEIDDVAPKILRYFNVANELRIITNEKAECEYSLTDCNFNFGEGIKMNSKDKLHTADWFEGVYYIKCKDIYGNTGSCESIRGYKEVI